MKEVDPQKLIQGQTYYLEYKLSPWQRADPDNYSYNVRGKFYNYDYTTYNSTNLKTAFFEDVESVNNKPPHPSLGVENSLLRFTVPPSGPSGCAYTIYPVTNPIGESFGGKKSRKSRKSRKTRKTKSRRRR
jgi:hypothetical protein